MLYSVSVQVFNRFCGVFVRVVGEEEGGDPQDPIQNPDPFPLGTRVKCRMWICSEMLVLAWMYFSSHRPLHLLLKLYNRNLCLSGKKSRTVRTTHKKNGITNIIQNHQPCLLPNCLMTKACERSALYHDRRTQGHETPKAML